MRDSPENVVGRVLEPGEEIVWCGRPEVAGALVHHNRRRGPLVIVLMVAAVAWLLWQTRERLGLESLTELLPMLPTDPKIWLAMASPLLLIFLVYVFKFDSRSRLRRYFKSLTYAITDRRLLILENDRITESYTPEGTPRPSLGKRAPGILDLVFAWNPASEDGKVTRDPVYRERRQVAFKALRDAEEIERLVERWLAERLREAEREVAEFVEEPSSHRPDRLPAGGRRIDGQALGLTLAAPAEWRVRVRAKRKPQGKFFIDREEWRELDDLEAWNLVRVEGPAHCRVEVEIFVTEPTVSFERMAHSKLSDSVSGEVVQSEPECEINGLRGFSVTRRNDMRVNRETNRAEEVAVVAPERHTVLHDGERQIYVISTWPEGSSELRRVVDSVVNSIRLE